MTKLCPRGKAAAKRKFKVYPSAYANAYASKICAGKIKDPSGVKRKDFKGPKPAGAKKGAMMIIIGIGKKKKPVKAKLGAAIAAIGAGAGSVAASAARANKKFADRSKAKKRDKIKVQNKMMGGMPTAGAMSGMGRLQKAQMKKGGGADTGKAGERTSKREVARYKMKRVLRGDPIAENSYSPYDISKKTMAILKGARDFRSAYRRDEAKAKMMNKGGGADYMNTVKAKKRGNPAVVGSPPKKRSGGGMVRGFGAAIRGKNFEGVF